MSPAFVPFDQTERDRATWTHDRNISVEAGAGTGKTTLLTSKYLALLEHTSSSPQKIVAITFTEKAASQLRDRIRAGLKKSGMEKDLEEIETAPISTIHSFCTTVLREEALQIGIDPQFNQLDELDLELFLRDAFRDWFTEASRDASESLEKAFSLNVTLKDIRDMAFALYRNRDVVMTRQFSKPTASSSSLFTDLLREAEALFQFATENCQDETDKGYVQIHELHETLQSFSETPPLVQERVILGRLKLSGARGAQKNWASKEACAEQKERCAALASQISEARKLIRTVVATDMARWLESFVEFSLDRKQQSGLLDFDDLLILTRDLLRKRPYILAKLQAKYDHILVDEFQDTDPVQAEIIWRLCGTDASAEPRWQDLPLEPGKLFLVGDPKQSIYRFRKADLDLYRHVTKALCEEGERIVIRQNFRSSKEILSFVNSSFSKVLGDLYEPLDAVPSHRTKDGACAVQVLATPTKGFQGKASELRRLEAEAIARSVRELLDSERAQVWDAKHERFRKVAAGDIGILFPTTTDIDVYEELLREHDVPFSLEGGKLFYGRAEIHALISTLNAAVHPLDSISVVSALRTLFFGLSDVQIYTLWQKSGTFDYRNLDTSGFDAATTRAIDILKMFHRKVSELSPSEFLRSLLSQTMAIPALLRRRHGEQAAANMEKFLAIAQKMERASAMSLPTFTRWLNRRSVEGEAQTEAPLSEHAQDRVQLMTIHKAKGLEFPVVFLANVSGEKEHPDKVYVDRLNDRVALGWGAQKQRFATKGFEDLRTQESEAQVEERKRLLYVAMTRAKDMLFLSEFGELAARKQYWSVLSEALDAVPNVPRISFEELTSGTAEEPSTVSKKKDGRASVRTLLDERQRLEKEREERVHLFRGRRIRSVTEVVHEAEGPTSASRRVSDSAAEAMRLGSAIHSLLERGAALPNLSEKDLAWTSRSFGLEGKADSIRALMKHFLESDLARRIRDAERRFPELPVTWKGENGEILQGAIDLVFFTNDGLEILDYKSDRISKDQVEERSAHYRRQLELYEDALRQAWNTEVRRSWIFFLHLGEAVDLKKDSR